MTTSHSNKKSTSTVKVDISADLTSLSPNDLDIIKILKEASDLIEVIFLKQSNQHLESQKGIFDESKLFNYYPQGSTVKQIESYLESHPEKKDFLLNPFSVVVEKDGGFSTIPYAKFFSREMEKVSLLLEEAAMLTENESFRDFLLKRSQSFITNEYRSSDISWIYVEGSPIELTIGPFEDYADTFFGVKREFQAVLGVVLENLTNDASGFQEMVSKFDISLGRKYGYDSNTTLTPMIVMDEIYASGRAIHASVPVAYNLPNDVDIQYEIGSKKVFIRNVMKAKFDLMTLPIAEKLLGKSNFNSMNFDTYLQFVIGHESAHGLSFRFDGKNFGTYSSALEECKADVFGMNFLYFMSNLDFIDESISRDVVKHNLVDGFRQIRVSTSSAHALGTIIQLNWFVHTGALSVTKDGIRFNSDLFEEGILDLGDLLFDLSQTFSEVKGRAFIEKWGRLSVEMESLLPLLANIPVNIKPVFS